MTNLTNCISKENLLDHSCGSPEPEDTGLIGSLGGFTCLGCGMTILKNIGIHSSTKWCISCYTRLEEKKQKITVQYGVKKLEKGE